MSKQNQIAIVKINIFCDIKVNIFTINQIENAKLVGLHYINKILGTISLSVLNIFYKI